MNIFEYQYYFSDPFFIHVKGRPSASLRSFRTSDNDNYYNFAAGVVIDTVKMIYGTFLQFDLAQNVFDGDDGLTASNEPRFSSRKCV